MPNTFVTSRRAPIAVPALFLLMFTSFMLSSCDKAKDLVKADVNFEMANIEFAIQPMTAGTGLLAESNTYFNVDSAIKSKAASFGVNNIKSAKLTSCQLTLLNATENNNIAAIQSCKAQLSAGGSQIALAEILNNPDSYATTLSLPVDNTVDLAAYLKATTFSYSLRGTLRRPITQQLDCKLTLTYKLELGL